MILAFKATFLQHKTDLIEHIKSIISFYFFFFKIQTKYVIINASIQAQQLYRSTKDRTLGLEDCFVSNFRRVGLTATVAAASAEVLLSSEV